MSNNILRTELSKQINSLSVDKDELKKILENLQEKANEAYEIETNYIETFDDSKEVLDIKKENLKKCTLLKLTIKGYNGEDLFGSIEEVFDEDIFPDRVKTLYVNSEIPYVSQFNYHPRNFFQLFIDFSKPKIFDFTIQPGERTPNNSNFKVEGYDNTWVNGVFAALDRAFLNKQIKFIHRVGLYDILVWIIGIPFAFWVCAKLSIFINTYFAVNIFLVNAAFVYIFFVSLFSIRILFHYSRWVYQMIEFKNKKDKSAMHRVALYGIALGMFGKFLYDIVKWIFNF